MKRTILLTLVLVFAAVFAFANGEGEGSGATFEDGIYFAQEDGFNERTGWKYMVTLEVKDGEIVDVEWNGANSSAGPDKITLSESGGYPMVEAGGAQSDWHVQSALVEEYLLEVQDPTAIEYDDEDGTTDAVSGVSIHINEFVTLAVEALEGGPIGYGEYEDGAYSAEQDAFSERTGWKDKVDLTVVSGYIVAAYWNPYNADGADKYVESVEGRYGMVENGGAQAPWFEQADACEAALLESQDPTEIPYDDDGYTDAISGVSVHVDSFFELAEEALADAM